MSVDLRGPAPVWGLRILLFIALVLVLTARAQAAEKPTIAIIDMQRILTESAAVQGMQSQIEEMRSDYQGELRKREEALRAQDQELARQRTVLSTDAFTRKRQELEQEVAAIQREIQSRRRELDSIFGQAMNQVRVALVEIVQEIAQERGADMVLTKATVVLVKPELEITDEALERLNERLPTIPLTVPQN